jgi:ABC-2 type transport system permease protein
VDADHSQLSKAFTTQVLGSPQLRKVLRVFPASTEAKAIEQVRMHDVSAAFVIPRNFESDVAAGRRAAIRVVRTPMNVIVGDIADAIAAGFAQQVNASRFSVFTALRAGAPAVDVPKLVRAAGTTRMPVQLVDGGVGARDVSGAQYFGPGMAIFFLFFIVGTGARSLLAEREQGTMPRILAAPGRRSSIILGKGIAVFVLGIASMTTMYVVMRVVFGVRWGDPLAIVALTLLIVLALMSVTSLVQTLAKTEAQAANYGSMIGMMFALVGGNFFPLFQMPKFVQTISALTPNGWALRGFTDVAYDGAHLVNVLPNVAAMAAFVAVCGTLAAIRARRITLA